jgi:hypothetical protein
MSPSNLITRIAELELAYASRRSLWPLHARRSVQRRAAQSPLSGISAYETEGAG